MMRRFATVAAAIACALAVMLTSGCFGASDEQIIREGITQALDEMADGESEARRQLVEELGSQDGMADLGIDPQEVSDSLFDGFAYEVGDIEVDSEQGTATAQVTLTSKSLSGVVDGLRGRIVDVLGSGDILTMTQDEINAEVGTMLEESLHEAPVEEHELSLPCTRDGEGSWALDESAGDVVGRALLGDLADASAQAQ